MEQRPLILDFVDHEIVEALCYQILKILFHPDTLKILGVHAIGESATEIIHIGQRVLALEGTIEFFRDCVFNYPTFAEAYKVAVLNGLNKL